MTRIRTGDADIDALPVAYTRGHNKPIGWHAGARCRDERAPHVRPVKGGGEPSVWLVDPERRYHHGNSIVKGSALQAMAVLECSMCAVQWDCIRFALSVDEPVGVWGMTEDDRDWLARQPDAARIVNRAEAAGRPIQFAVVSVRRRRRR